MKKSIDCKQKGWPLESRFHSIDLYVSPYPASHLPGRSALGRALNLGGVSPRLCCFLSALAALSPSTVHVDFRVSLSVCSKQPAGILMGTVLNLEMGQGIPAVLTAVRFSIWERDGVFHLSRSLTGQHCFVLFTAEVLHSFVKFMPKYFILFDVITNGVIFLISIFDFPLQVCESFFTHLVS